MTNRSTDAKPLDEAMIVETAGRFVDRYGPEQLTLTRIADELGVTQPALYRHVEGLPSLWRALGISTRADLAAALAEAGLGRSGPDALRAVATAWRQYGREHPGRYLSTGRHAVAGDDALVEAVHRTMSVLERSLQGFGLDPEATRGAAETMRSAMHGFVSYEVGDGHPDPSRLDQSFEQLVNHLCAAFSSAVGENVATHASRR